ncbi:MAG TPA: flagellar filament capping protein FliD, partial [Longimicrobiaceae bacterium]
GTGGAAGGVAAGDTFTVRGTRADGSAVSLAYTVGGADTVQDFLDRINGADGFGRPGSPAATATLENGRIRLTDAAGGDSQLSLAITANNEGGGTLGFGTTATAVTGRLREVVAGSDARLRLDGVLLSRQGNSVSDALTGVTLNLQQAEPGTVVELSVARDTDAIVSSVKGFASAYNAVADFVKGQGAAGSPLAGNGTLRSTLSSLTSVLLTPVEGLGSTTYRRPTIAGVSLSRTGQLEVDDARLRAALASNLADVKALFGTAGTTTDGEVSFVNSTAKTQPGSYAVSVTAAATRAGVTGSGFSGVYSDDGSADTLTLTDAVSGKSGSIQLAGGDTAETIAAKLNTLFQTEGMKLTASRSGSELSLSGTDYGSAASFTVAWSGGGSDGTAQLGLAAGSYAGTDVQGTLGGLAATGLGQVLSGAAGGATEGLAVKYTGSTARAAGSVGFVLGTGGMMTRLVDQLTRAGDGTVSGQVDSLRRSIDSLNSRAEEVQKRLEVRREAMVRQFTAMEQALSRVQSQGSWLAAQISSMQAR